MVLASNQTLHTNIFIRDLPSNTIQEPPSASNEWSISLRHMGPDIAQTNLVGDHSSLTGYNAPGGQVGNGRGIVFQNYSGVFGSYIDSTKIPFEAVTGGGPHSIIMYDFAVPPLMIVNHVPLSFSFGAAVPTFSTSGGVAQVSLVGYLSDSNNAFCAFVILIFDNRGADFVPYVGNDTFTSFVSSPFKSSRYFTVNAGSEVSSGQVFSQTKMFSGSITEANLQNIVSDLNAQSTNVFGTNYNNYRLHSIGILHEVFIFNNAANSVVSGFHTSGLTIKRI